MDQANPLSAPMIGRNKICGDPYHHCEMEEEEIDKSRYLTAVGAFTYLTTHTRLDIVFATNILTRYSQKSTNRHQNGVKHVMRYMRGTIDLGLHYQKTNHSEITSFADFGFRTNEIAGKFQT